MYDFVVLGGGSGGYAAARTAVELGLKTAVVDGSAELGGLCILRGCMPSKTLIESANRSLVIQEAEDFGLRASGTGVDLPGIVSRKRRLIADFADYRRGQLEDGEFDLIRGRGRFADGETMAVDLLDGGERRLPFRTALIATGSSIAVPPLAGLEEAGYLTSDDILEAESLPDSMLVLGGGAVALEMAHYLEGIGVDVTVVQRSAQVLREADADVAEALCEALCERGIEIHCGTHVEDIDADGDGKRVRFRQGDEVREVKAREILAALGRTPATDGLDLEAAGVGCNGKLISVDESMETSNPRIFAAGDVCGPLEVVHMAIEQGEIAAWNAAVTLDKVPRHRKRMDYRLRLFGVFTEPQVAMVGATEKELRGEGKPYRSASYPFDDHGKSLVMGKGEGFVKLIADAGTGELLGGAIVGPEGVELIHEVVVAMGLRATAGQLARIPHYHPTLSEIWIDPAEELAEAIEAGESAT